MIHPITFWLWTFLSVNLGLQPQVLSFNHQPPKPRVCIYGDSTVFNELKTKLEHRQKETAPEKLYLHLDRTLYQPGETAWFNAYVRNAGDLLPSAQSQILYLELSDPRGAVISQKTYLAPDGIAAGDFDFPKELPGGLYKIRAYTRWMQNTSEVFERTLVLQKVVLPNINLKLEFERKAVGPGEIAIARFDASSLDNQVLANRKITYTVAIGGQPFSTGEAQTDAGGRAYVRFQLPEKLETSDGLLNIQIEHKGQTEAISRAVPIVLNKIDLQFFPEGGDAVAGLPCRMAFKALNEFGKPADVEGAVFNSRGEQVSTFSSYHDGMGAFDFVPQSGEPYTARLTKPVASSTGVALPVVMEKGYTLRLQERSAENLTFEVSSCRDGALYLMGTSQDKPFYFKELTYNTEMGAASTQKVSIRVKDLPIGIARFTLFDRNKTEQAERLVFVNRDKGLKIDLQPDKQQYLPREKVKMNIRVSDSEGWPVQGNFSLAVSDEKQLTFADDKQGNLLASLLLEQDVKGKVEEPNYYFDPAEPKSEQALDYLLMTQGWRRFVWEEVMDAKPVAYQFPAERTAVEGILLKRNGKPLKGAEVSLYPSGPAVTTDQEGRFSFKNVDLQNYTHLHFWRDGYYPLYDYDSDLVLRDKSKNTVKQALANIYYRAGTPGNAAMVGQVTDDTGETLIGASVKIMKGDQFIRGCITDFDGNYRVTPLDPGNYDVEYSYTGYESHRVTGVRVLPGQLNFVDITLKSGTVLSEVEVVSYKVPLIEQDKTMSGQVINMPGSRPAPSGRASKPKTVTADEIRKMPTQNVNAIVATTAGVNSAEKDDVNIKGSRSNATVYHLDGIRVSGAAPPVQDIEDMQVITGGLGAEFENDLAAMEDEPVLNEVVVVGFGNQKREESAELKAAARSTLRFDDRAKKMARRQDDTVYQPRRGQSRQFDRARAFYVPAYTAQQQPAQRSDFRSTIYWNPAVKTDRKGFASVEFYTSDAITNFRATLEGIGNAGQPGRAEKKFFVQKPLDMVVKAPASVITGDVLNLQIALTNHTAYASGGELEIVVPVHFNPTPGPSPEGRGDVEPNVTVDVASPLPSGEGLGVGSRTAVQLAPGETKIISAQYTIGAQKSGDQSLKIQFSADENVLDGFETSIRTLERGFPARQVAAGNAAQNAFNIHLGDPVEGTLSATLTAYPSALEDVLKGMERMLRQPSGCFEQVSSSNYPNLLVLDLLRQTGTAKPEVESRALTLLEDGYKKLTAYESPSGGFDWWGRDPAHEGLTAYGILEFTDMAKVFNVDKKMIDRTVDWLYKRRDSKGGWTLNPNSLHGWQNDPVIDCYIVWALAEAGYGKKFATEINQAYDQAAKSKDSYQMALLANALLAMKDERGVQLLKQLSGKQESNGSWLGSTHSVMYASGECFRIETTSLAALAMMKSDAKSPGLSKAVDYLTKSKTEYGYGSTQSTVMALKALIEYAKAGNHSAGDGTLVVSVDGRRVIEQPFSTKDPKRLEIKNIERFFTNNDPRVEVFFDNPEAVIPFDLEIKYASRQPRNTPNCPLAFNTRLGTAKASVGETVRLSATLQNTTAQVQGSPMIVLGIPAGLTLQPWQLKKLVDEKKCDFYELWDGFAVFHFEQIAPGETRSLDLDLRADVAGSFESPASQAFLYYSNDQRVWSKPERLEIGN